jgi:hypothetical protein
MARARDGTNPRVILACLAEDRTGTDLLTTLTRWFEPAMRSRIRPTTRREFLTRLGIGSSVVLLEGGVAHWPRLRQRLYRRPPTRLSCSASGIYSGPGGIRSQPRSQGGGSRSGHAHLTWAQSRCTSRRHDGAVWSSRVEPPTRCSALGLRISDSLSAMTSRSTKPRNWPSFVDVTQIVDY